MEDKGVLPFVGANDTRPFVGGKRYSPICGGQTILAHSWGAKGTLPFVAAKDTCQFAGGKKYSPTCGGKRYSSIFGEQIVLPDLWPQKILANLRRRGGWWGEGQRCSSICRGKRHSPIWGQRYSPVCEGRRYSPIFWVNSGQHVDLRAVIQIRNASNNGTLGYIYTYVLRWGGGEV